jgi:hypothetical protein
MAARKVQWLKNGRKADISKSLYQEPALKFSDDGTVTYFW